MAVAAFNPGRMNQRVIIEEKSQTKDSQGALDSQWIPKHDVLASIEYATGTTYRIKTRWVPGVRINQRVRTLDDEIYRIMTPVDAMGKQQWLMLMCEHQDRCQEE